MKLAQGKGSPVASLHMVISVLFLLVGLLTSTAIITRAIVLGGFSVDSDRRPEIQKSSLTIECPSLETSKVISQETSNVTAQKPLNGPSELPGSGYSFYQEALDTKFDLHGYVLSSMKGRVEYVSTVLAKLGITAHKYEPPPYNSQFVYDEMKKFQNSTKYHNDRRNLKMFSNRLGHTGMLHMFVSDQTAKINSWRFFFEDDIELHPKLSPSIAKATLKKGLELASGDGILYLGICAPEHNIAGPEHKLGNGILAKKTYGTCTHAYGVTKWRAAGILSHLDKVKIPLKDRAKGMMFYDLLLKYYGSTVTSYWVLGVNLRSPVPKATNHVGLLYQDRVKHPSSITSPEETRDHSDLKKSRH